MNDSKERSALIVKNTLYMYGRMFVTLIVSLFTARIVYNTLGVDNYGVYSVVGGIIVLFTFLNNGLSSATKRFITTEIARGEDDRIKHVFNTCIQAPILISLVVLLFAETLGVWFINNKLNIPEELMRGANWAYQFSVVSTVLAVMQSPFSASIVAYEKMNIFAAFTVTDVIFNLLVIYAVQVIPGNKLIIYSALVFVVGVINMIMYRAYTFIKIPTCRLKRVKDTKLLKEVFSFTSWSIMGQVAIVGANQGITILINIFYNVAVNAAMGVSNSIIRVVSGFVSNFQVAFNPQIIKSYNSGDYTYLQSLIVRASKLSSYLIILFLVPLVFETPRVLELWLGDYPEYAVEFCILTLVCVYIESIAAPLWMLVYSQTNIKRYQLIIALIYSLNFWGGWLALYLGAVPYSVIIVRLLVFLILLFVRLFYVKRIWADFDAMAWLNQVVIKSAIIIALSLAIVGGLNYILNVPTLMHIIVITVVSLCSTIPLIYFYGMSINEQQFVSDRVINILKFNR